MSNLKSTDLYKRYAELLVLEERADIAFDELDSAWATMSRSRTGISDEFTARYEQARDARDALFDERISLRETLLRLPRPDGDQLQINLEIVAKEADIFDGAGDYVRLVAAQVRTFVEQA